MAAVEEGRFEFGNKARSRLAAIGASVAADPEGKALQGEFNLSGGGV